MFGLLPKSVAVPTFAKLQKYLMPQRLSISCTRAIELRDKLFYKLTSEIVSVVYYLEANARTPISSIPESWGLSEVELVARVSIPFKVHNLRT